MSTAAVADVTALGLLLTQLHAADDHLAALRTERAHHARTDPEHRPAAAAYAEYLDGRVRPVRENRALLLAELDATLARTGTPARSRREAYDALGAARHDERRARAELAAALQAPRRLQRTRHRRMLCTVALLVAAWGAVAGAVVGRYAFGDTRWASWLAWGAMVLSVALAVAAVAATRTRRTTLPTAQAAIPDAVDAHTRARDALVVAEAQVAVLKAAEARSAP